MIVDSSAARALFSGARVARLATVDAQARPHLVPVCFALAGETVYSAVDQKPKSTRRLRRLENVEANPRVALLADHYEDADWDRLWWARADGHARVLGDGDRGEAERAIELLCERYEQYRRERPEGPVLAVDVKRWSGWRAG